MWAPLTFHSSGSCQSNAGVAVGTSCRTRGMRRPIAFRVARRPSPVMLRHSGKSSRTKPCNRSPAVPGPGAGLALCCRPSDNWSLQFPVVLEARPFGHRQNELAAHAGVFLVLLDDFGGEVPGEDQDILRAIESERFDGTNRDF